MPRNGHRAFKFSTRIISRVVRLKRSQAKSRPLRGIYNKPTWIVLIRFRKTGKKQLNFLGEPRFSISFNEGDSMKKHISYVLSDAEQLYGTDLKIISMLKEMGFFMSDKIIAFGAEYYLNHETGQEVALVKIPKSRREDYYRNWIDSGNLVASGKTLRYLLDKDFEDWAASRGEWS